jgi:hypothetical protein
VLDANGDGLLDLLGGRTPEEESGGGCLYLNASEPGPIRFVPDPRVCNQDLRATSVSAFDVDGDGKDEMFLMFFQNIVEVRLTESGVTQYQHFDPSLFTDARALCDPSSLVPMDIDLDGDLDALVGCTSPNSRVLDMFEDDVSYWLQTHLLRNQDGQLRLETGPWAEELSLLGNPLTFGLVDLDENGLIDLVATNDSFSTEGRRNLHLAPGTLHVRCRPDETCIWHERQVVDGEQGFGSFMGVGVVRVAAERLLLLTDWGAKRALDLGAEGWPDAADRFGLQLPDNDGFALYSWSALVDDFDLDGLDDILFTHGMPADGDVPGHGAHVPFLVVQNQDEQFSLYKDGLGFLLPAQRMRVQREVPPSQRSAIRADFDRDGILDLLLVFALGFPELYTDATGQATRCTVFPQPAFAPAWGHSFAFRLHADDVWHEWFVWGGMRVGNANALLLPARQGELRWPSGAVTPWDCGIRTTLTLTEPEWLTIAREDAEVSVQIDMRWWKLNEAQDLSLHWRLNEQTGVETVQASSPGLWRLSGIPDGARVLVQLDDRYIPRWWQL